MMATMRLAAILAVLFTMRFSVHAAFDPKQLATRANVSAMLVFGDSSVDPGNNNHLPTTNKANFPPYGKDFFRGHPTGRFSNGRLPTDFIAEAMGIGEDIPAFLDPGLEPEQLLHGVSFASASSGYDDLTAQYGRVLPIHKQMEYLSHYKIHLSKLVGKQEGDGIVRNAVFVMSAGTNDFIQNYYLEPNRSKQFTVQEYENFLINHMSEDITELHRLGARRIALVGIPPMGCFPIIKTLLGSGTCIDSFNQVAISFNSKLKSQIDFFKKSLGIRAAYIDVYGVLMDATKNPAKYGLTETAKGCCGSGIVEFGETCMGQSTCQSPNSYMYWDAVHPSERMYRIIAEEALQTAIKELLL